MVNRARVIKVIETEESRGGGTGPDDAFRIVTCYFSLEGELLAENDPFPNGKATKSSELVYKETTQQILNQHNKPSEQEGK